MRRRSTVSLLCALCCVAGLALSQTAPRAQGQGRRGPSARQTVTGTVVGVGGRLGGRSWPFTLNIERYTTPEEVQQLNTALQSGEDELLRVLSRMEAGRIRIGNNVGVPANAIISTPQELGTKLTVLYERNVSIFERRAGTRSEDYRFGYAELFLRGRGAGEGTLIPAARVRLRAGNTWEVEDFGVFPARLMGLQLRGGRGMR